MATDLLLNLIALRRGMTSRESLLVTRDLLDQIIRALELHPCREALAQALDRLEKVQAYKEDRLDTLPAVTAVIALLRLRIAQDKTRERLEGPMTVQGNPWPEPGQRIAWTRYTDKTGKAEAYEATGGIAFVTVVAVPPKPDAAVMIGAVEDESGDRDIFDALRHPWRAL